MFQSIARGAMVREAVAAVDGLVAARLEGNLGLLAAVSADRGEHPCRSRGKRGFRPDT